MHTDFGLERYFIDPRGESSLCSYWHLSQHLYTSQSKCWRCVWIVPICFKLQYTQPCKVLTFTFMSSFSAFFIQWVVLREPAALPCLLPRGLKEHWVLSPENKQPYSLDNLAVQWGGWGKLSIPLVQQRTLIIHTLQTVTHVHLSIIYYILFSFI